MKCHKEKAKIRLKKKDVSIANSKAISWRIRMAAKHIAMMYKENIARDNNHAFAPEILGALKIESHEKNPESRRNPNRPYFKMFLFPPVADPPWADILLLFDNCIDLLYKHFTVQKINYSIPQKTQLSA